MHWLFLFNIMRKTKTNKSRLINITEHPEFIIINEDAQVYSGLIKGYPSFSDNWDEAKPLTNPECLSSVQRGTFLKLEIHYL
jgi:hypothetical protein